MERALEIFYDEYMRYKTATLQKYKKAKIDFETIKEQIDKHGPTEGLKSALFSLSHGLFQINYMLMEARLHLHNIGCYTGERKKEIDNYEKVHEMVNNFIGEIVDYSKELEVSNEFNK